MGRSSSGNVSGREYSAEVQWTEVGPDGIGMQKARGQPMETRSSRRRAARARGACRIHRMLAESHRKRATSVVRKGRTVVRYERGALSREEAEAFASLAASGIRELGRLLGGRGGAPLRFELRSGGHISSARGRTISLPAFRVRARTAPYLHEIAHRSGERRVG